MIRINTIFLTALVLIIFSGITLIVKCDIMDQKWAVLVAGSKGYTNYRHQADIAHAYQLLLKGGFYKDQIITMMYNDVVNCAENPQKGKLFNKPNGPDVYNGLTIDYADENVTVDNFIGILNGTGKTGKVLKIKKTDKVFIFMSDHGAPGMFAFPSEMLLANQLVKEVKKLSTRADKVEIFVESSQSGSLFLNHITPKDRVLLGFTGTNAKESSFACYWSDEMNVYLGDLFSVSWMETVETVDTKNTRFFQLYDIVKNLTNESHVLSFGDKLMTYLPLKEFFGILPQRKKSNKESLVFISQDNVHSHDSQLFTMIRRCKKNQTQECLDKIKYLKQSIRKLNTIFNKLKMEMEMFKAKNNILPYHSPYPDHVYSCYKNSVMLFSKICINYNDVEKTFSYLGTFLEMCSNRMDEQHIAKLIKKIANYQS